MPTIPARWTLLDITYADIEDGFRITLWTDTPCHLFMNWTTKQPWFHPKSVILRGLPVFEDVRTCFVVPHRNEQLEEGDTYIHTFVKEAWYYCQTRWFYYDGTISGIVSPSNTPLFSLHKIQPDFIQIFIEQWTRLYPPPPDMEMLFREEWSII